MKIKFDSWEEFDELYYACREAEIRYKRLRTQVKKKVRIFFGVKKSVMQRSLSTEGFRTKLPTSIQVLQSVKRS